MAREAVLLSTFAVILCGGTVWYHFHLLSQRRHVHVPVLFLILLVFLLVLAVVSVIRWWLFGRSNGD